MRLSIVFCVGRYGFSLSGHSVLLCIVVMSTVRLLVLLQVPTKQDIQRWYGKCTNICSIKHILGRTNHLSRCDDWVWVSNLILFFHFSFFLPLWFVTSLSKEGHHDSQTVSKFPSLNSNFSAYSLKMMRISFDKFQVNRFTGGIDLLKILQCILFPIDQKEFFVMNKFKVALFQPYKR